MLPPGLEVHSACFIHRPPSAVLVSGVAQSLGSACSVLLSRAPGEGGAYTVKSSACACAAHWREGVCGHASSLVHALLHDQGKLVDAGGEEVDRIPWLSSMTLKAYNRTSSVCKALIDDSLQERAKRAAQQPRGLRRVGA